MRLTIIITIILILGQSYAVQDNGTTQVLNPQFNGTELSIPKSINFQGYLYRDGTPMDTTMNMWFGIYDLPTGGSILFQQTINNVEVMNGWFTITLDNIPNTVFPVSGPTRYLEIKAPSTGPALVPRFSLVSVGYSYHAITSDTAEYAKEAPVGSHSHSLTHTGEVTGSGSVNGSWALTITNGAVTNAKLDPNAVTTGKIQNGTILPEDLSFVPVTRPLTPPLSGTEIAVPCTLQGSVAWPGAVLRVRNNEPTGAGIKVPRAGWYGVLVDTVTDYAFWADNSWTGLGINRAISDGIWIERTGNNGIRIDSAGADGLYINRAVGDGVHINRTNSYGLHVKNAATGVLIDSAAAYGVYINRPEFYGVYVANAGSDGVWVNQAGDDGFYLTNAVNRGLYIHTTGNEGVYINRTGTDGFRVYRAGQTGVYIDSAGEDGIEIYRTAQNGVQVRRANWMGFRVDSAGLNGMTVFRAGQNGFTVFNAGLNGIFIDSAGVNGVWVDHAAKYGVYVHNADSNGLYINNAGQDGLKINHSNNFGLNIDYAGYCGVKIDSTHPNWTGMYIRTTGHNGYAVDDVGSRGLWIMRTGDDGVGIIDSTGRHGFYVNRAHFDGVSVVDAGRYGMRVENAASSGLWVGGGYDGITIDSAYDDGIQITEANYGVYIPSANRYGIDVANAGWYGVYANSNDEQGGYFRNNNNIYYALTAYNATGSGATTKGLYVRGNGYATGGWTSFLADGKAGYSLTSPDMEVVTSGTGSLINGKTQITFEKTMREAFSSDVPLKIIITPTSQCNGIFVANKFSSGFTAEELMNGKSNATFDWIAIGRIKGYEQRPEVNPPTTEEMRRIEERNQKAAMEKLERENQMREIVKEIPKTKYQTSGEKRE